MFTIHEIVQVTNATVINSGNVREITGVSIDSRTAESGNIFFAIKGKKFDGHDFIKDVMSKDLCKRQGC